jgi:SAM-dependent methyltransferase
MEVFEMEIQIKSDSRKLSEVIKSLMQNVPEKGFILDAGCGNFYYTNIIKKTSREIICLDIVRPEKDFIRNNMFFHGSIERLPFKNSSFDFIYCFSVIQFIDNDRAVIEEFYRVLKPGGRLLLTIPTRNSPFRIIRDLEIYSGVYKFPQFNVNHHHYYSIKDIYNLIFNTFQLESITGYHYNFIPRLFNLLLDMSNQRNGCSTISKYFSKKNKNSYERHSNQSLNRSISNIIYGFAYHYIVLLKK